MWGSEPEDRSSLYLSEMDVTDHLCCLLKVLLPKKYDRALSPAAAKSTQGNMASVKHQPMLHSKPCSHCWLWMCRIGWESPPAPPLWPVLYNLLEDSNRDVYCRQTPGMQTKPTNRSAPREAPWTSRGHLKVSFTGDQRHPGSQWAAKRKLKVALL